MPDDATFSADWLALREPVDARSRSASLLHILASHWPALAGSEPIRVADLGAGTGANLRYQVPHLPGPSQWYLLDHDPALLSRAWIPGGSGQAVFIPQVADLSRLSAAVPADVRLVTASALIDLTSAEWIRSLCDVCACQRAALLVALSVTGHVQLTPADPLDHTVLAALSADQQRDKGLGVAAAAAAPAVLVRALSVRGYRVWVRPSDWFLVPGDAPLLEGLLMGWHQAALRRWQGRHEPLDAWLARRLRQVRHGALRVVVGHVDVLGLP